MKLPMAAPTAVPTTAVAAFVTRLKRDADKGVQDTTRPRRLSCGGKAFAQGNLDALSDQCRGLDAATMQAQHSLPLLRLRGVDCGRMWRRAAV
jgi:hypothetical protein